MKARNNQKRKPETIENGESNVRKWPANENKTSMKKCSISNEELSNINVAKEMKAKVMKYLEK